MIPFLIILIIYLSEYVMISVLGVIIIVLMERIECLYEEV